MSNAQILPEHEGKYYVNWMLDTMKLLGAQNYFEIGSRDGNSLRPVSLPSIAIDPQFALTTDVIGSKPCCHLFQMTSDRFFQNYNPQSILNSKLDFVFLDGLHMYEFLLRDFINTEHNSRNNTLICMHDCLPTELALTTRLQVGSNAWTGDVWKVPMILAKYRPDIKIYYLNCQPTGLVVCTNLNPNSTVISENYFDIIDEYSYDDALSGEQISAFYSSIKLCSAADISSIGNIEARFWL